METGWSPVCRRARQLAGQHRCVRCAPRGPRRRSRSARAGRRYLSTEIASAARSALRKDHGWITQQLERESLRRTDRVLRPAGVGTAVVLLDESAAARPRSFEVDPVDAGRDPAGRFGAASRGPTQLTSRRSRHSASSGTAGAPSMGAYASRRTPRARRASALPGVCWKAAPIPHGSPRSERARLPHGAPERARSSSPRKAPERPVVLVGEAFDVAAREPLGVRAELALDSVDHLDLHPRRRRRLGSWRARASRAGASPRGRLARAASWSGTPRRAAREQIG